MTDVDGFADEQAPLSVEIVRGDPDAAEVAALLAVVGEAYTDEAYAAPLDPPRRSRWDIAARQLRAPLQRDRGWRGFSG